MAEEYVSKDQHRADLAELRLELKEELHGLRQDVAVLAKTVELGFADLRREMGEMRREMSELRQEMREMRQEMRQEMRGWRTSTSRQMWVIVAAVVVALLKTVLLP